MNEDDELTRKLEQILDQHGPEVLTRVGDLIRERAETFPDRSRKVKWLIGISRDGSRITLDVQP